MSSLPPNPSIYASPVFMTCYWIHTCIPICICIRNHNLLTPWSVFCMCIFSSYIWQLTANWSTLSAEDTSPTHSLLLIILWRGLTFFFFWDLRFSNPRLFSEALSILKLQHHEDAKQNYIYIHIFHRLILSEETFNRQIFKWRKHNYITFSCGLSSIIHMYSQCYSTGFFTEELVKASLDNIQIYSLC